MPKRNFKNIEEERFAVIEATISSLRQASRALRLRNNIDALEWFEVAKEGANSLYENLKHTNLIELN